MGKLFDSENFAIDIFKKRRLKDNLNIRDCADLIGISVATLSRLENGKIPDVESFIRVCKWLDTDMNLYVLD